MLIKKFNVLTTNLNIFVLPDKINNSKIDFKANLNLEILPYVENKQKIILNYTIKSYDAPLHIIWESDVNIIFNEKLKENISREDFFNYSNVIFSIDEKIEYISKISGIKLPLLSEQ